MRVEIDAFSGRPNPSWELSPDEAAELARRLADLPNANAPAPAPGLGYRGFVITNPEGSHGLPDLLRIHDGAVAIVQGASTQHYHDVHGVESWLAAQARAHGYGDLVTD
jgi:hypothetical protein